MFEGRLVVTKPKDVHRRAMRDTREAARREHGLDVIESGAHVDAEQPGAGFLDKSRRGEQWAGQERSTNGALPLIETHTRVGLREQKRGGGQGEQQRPHRRTSHQSERKPSISTATRSSAETTRL